MNTKFDLSQLGESHTDKLVYIKSVPVADLPEEMQAQAKGVEAIYAVHSAEGERLALVANRKLAFHLARKNDMSPVTVH
jgi:hypothetical protein